MFRRARLREIAVRLGTVVLIGCAPQSAPESAGPQVTTIVVAPREVALGDELPGQTRASSVAEIRPRVSAAVVQRAFAEGAQVRAGDLLYRLDEAPFAAAVRQAEAVLAVARRNVARGRAAWRASVVRLEQRRALAVAERSRSQRLDALFREGIVSAAEHAQIASQTKVAEAELFAAEADVERDRQAIAAGEAEILRAEAAAETARLELADTQITAPIGGTIVSSSATEGTLVTPRQPVPMATIMTFDPILVDVTVPAERAVVAESGPLDVRLTSDDDTVSQLEGTVDAHEVSIYPAPGVVTVRAAFANPDGRFRPGRRVWVFVHRGIEQGIAIPWRAMRRDARGTPHAWVVDAEGRVATRALEIVGAAGRQWLVRAGLASGDEVIVDGVDTVRPGEVVRAVHVAPESPRRI